jgi:hypothetical protein
VRTRSRRTDCRVEYPKTAAVDPVACELTGGAVDRNRDYLTRSELAALLHRAVRTLQWWEQQKIGPPVIHFQNVTLYKRSSVERWLDEHETRSRNAFKTGSRS